jgi:ABC-type lipoprotein release transport system permease subunit
MQDFQSDSEINDNLDQQDNFNNDSLQPDEKACHQSQFALFRRNCRDDEIAISKYINITIYFETNLMCSFSDRSSKKMILKVNQQDKRKLDRLEGMIQSTQNSKKDRRLFQNRKSALKCRLKRQTQLGEFKEKLGVVYNELQATKN